MGKIKSAISGIGGIGSNARSSVLDFEEAPLANAGYLLTVGAMCVALPTFIVALALAINNIGVANQSNLSSSTNANFLSAGTLYLQSISTAIFAVLFVAALILFIAYKVKSPVSKGGKSISYELRIWVIGVAFSLVVAPLVLLFAENILTIIIILVVCVVGFLFISSAGSGNEEDNHTQPASKPKEEKQMKDNRSVLKVNPKKVAIYNMTKYKHLDMCEGDWYVEVGTGMHGKDNVRPLCTVEQYRRGKYKFVNRDNGKEYFPR